MGVFVGCCLVIVIVKVGESFFFVWFIICIFFLCM